MTMMIEWQTNLREQGLPLVDALSLRVPAAPRAFLRQLCKKRRVCVDNCVSEADQLVLAGERVAVKTSERFMVCLEKSRIVPEMVLYEDDQSIVVNKPAGLAIHRAAGHNDNLLHRLQDFLALRGETFQVSPIHRLDIGTSGAALFGKGRASISQLGQMVMAGLMTKHYLALVSSKITQPGALTTSVPAKGSSKESLSRFHPVATSDDYTLLDVELITGRHHQIRHQLSLAGWPIVGDSRYRGKSIMGLERPFLHCRQLAFPRLPDEKLMTIDCFLPEDLQKQLATLLLITEAVCSKTYGLKR